MKRSRLFRMGVAAKLAICVIASTAAFFSFFGLLNLRSEQHFSQDQVEQSAHRITDLIVRSTHYEMLRNDRDALLHMIREVGSGPGIQRIRILNKDGLIIYSTDSPEMGTPVDKKAEGCIACHAQSAPLARLTRKDRTRYFTDKDGQRMLAVMQGIDNAPECSNASCHVHDTGRSVLGVIDTTLSLAAVDRQLATHRANLTWFLMGATLFGCGAAVAFVWVVVHRPVRELTTGMKRAAAGDLDYRLPAGRDDELGDLAASFNKMTAEVGGVQAKIEEQVRRKTAELERVHKTLLHSEKMASIGKLAATVAHEINNPLFGILTYARLVLRELLKHDVAHRDEMAEQLQTIERESKRCGELVKSLLTFSRQAPSIREPNDLNIVAHRAVVLVQHKLAMQNIELEERLAPDMPPVSCDANQIQQVVLVLMMNAADAMGKGGKLLVATELDADSDLGVVRVKDNGSGIPADVLPHIFDPFFTTKEDQNRTGLGLAVAHNIVEQHAGDILVDSTPGVGTEFRVALPLAAVASGVSQLELGKMSK
jgi:two-component system NtrC family sensor kinase